MSTKDEKTANTFLPTPGNAKEWFTNHRAMLLKLHQEGKLPFDQIEELLMALEKAVMNPPMIDEVDILKHFVGDPLCKKCGGSKRLGINRIPDKNLFAGSFYQLQLCACATQEKSEYLKMEELIVGLSKVHHDNTIELRMSIDRMFMKLDEQVAIQRENVQLLDNVLHRIDRHTAGYWIAKALKPITDRWEAWEQRRIEAKNANDVVAASVAAEVLNGAEKEKEASNA